MEVELDVFSGHPNPRWQLDQLAGQRMAALIRQLGAGTGNHLRNPPPLPGLGYRGFIFVSDGVRWRAWKGFVVSDSTTLSDREKRVERWLLAHLPEEHHGLHERILAEIDQPPPVTR